MTLASSVFAASNAQSQACLSQIFTSSLAEIKNFLSILHESNCLLDFQDASKAAPTEKRTLRFQEGLGKEEPASERPAEKPQAARKKLPRRHTGYAFDHPGFESFHANEVRHQLKLSIAALDSDTSPCTRIRALPLALCPLIKDI